MDKTMKGWNESGKDLNQFLQIGDAVDIDLYWYFVECMPPVTLNRKVVQMGEPYSHTAQGRPTYATLKAEGLRWIYKGNLTTEEGRK